jgi:hypothetical protein
MATPTRVASMFAEDEKTYRVAYFKMMVVAGHRQPLVLWKDMDVIDMSLVYTTDSEDCGLLNLPAQPYDDRCVPFVQRYCDALVRRHKKW